MQNESLFVKEQVFAHKGWNWIRTIVHISFYWKKGIFLQYVFKQSALGLIVCLISSQQRSAKMAEQQVLLVQSIVVVAPKEKNQEVLNQALHIATTEWGLTAQIISSAYINRWSVGSRGVDNYSVWEGGISSVSVMGGSPGDVSENLWRRRGERRAGEWAVT